MNITEKTEAFEKLGIFLEQFEYQAGLKKINTAPWLEELNKKFFQSMVSLIETSHINNPWFTENNVRYALGVLGRSLTAEALSSWLSCYGNPTGEPKTVAVVMAGNIPLVGFHDMLCIMISNHRMLAKLSARDNELYKLIAEILCFINNEFASRISLTEGRLEGFDAVIATGSNNTSRYFEYYFGKYPNIIRKNRSSAAVLNGSEDEEDLGGLADDVFRYFGLGCRSVSKIFVPPDYDFEPMLSAFNKYHFLINHNQWANNYEYQKAIHLIDKIPHLDTGFILLREDRTFSSPIAVLSYEIFENQGKALDFINDNKDKLQCVIGDQSLSGSITPFGRSQEPRLNEYADNVDTLDFLLNI
jgi:hypothetical protein